MGIEFFGIPLGVGKQVLEPLVEVFEVASGFPRLNSTQGRE
jgi:hypothetical protein